MLRNGDDFLDAEGHELKGIEFQPERHRNEGNQRRWHDQNAKERHSRQVRQQTELCQLMEMVCSERGNGDTGNECREGNTGYVGSREREDTNRDRPACPE